MAEEDKNKELILASEEVTRRNVIATVEFSQETRKLVRELEQKTIHLENQLLAQKTLLEEYRSQLSKLQQQFYLKGTTSYNE